MIMIVITIASHKYEKKAVLHNHCFPDVSLMKH